MRRWTGKFLPVVLVALMVQIFAPIGATWAASIAASDPLQAAVICHGEAAGDPTGHSDPSGQPRAHEGACSMCCLAHAGASVDTPQAAAVTTLYRRVARVVWRDATPDLFGSRTGSHAQARAPPSIS
jgi:DUF2946 family protein